MLVVLGELQRHPLREQAVAVLLRLVEEDAESPYSPFPDSIVAYLHRFRVVEELESLQDLREAEEHESLPLVVEEGQSLLLAVVEVQIHRHHEGLVAEVPEIDCWEEVVEGVEIPWWLVS